MQQFNLTFTESVEGALIFKYEGRSFLYAGRKDGFVYGISTVGNNWKVLLEDAGNREYEKVGEAAVKMGLDFVTFDLALIKIDTMASVSDLVETHDEFDGLGVMTISKTDCRSPDGITIGLIDGMIAMARVLRKANLGSAEVQEALKDFTADEDVKWLMENSVQDWSFGEEADADWPTATPAALALAKAPYKYKVHYSNKTWPLGWDKEESVKESDSLEEIQAWLLDKVKWCMMEDNGFKARIFVHGGNEGFPYSAGMLQWDSETFAGKPLGWKPTLENTGIAECAWVAP